MSEAHLNLALQARLAAHRSDHSALIHLNSVVVNVEHALVPGPNEDIVVAVGLDVLQVHDVIPARKKE